jgi:hypothetical protein
MTDTPNICWHDDEATQRHCRHSDIDDRDLITWGRCHSGQRWFWAASVFLEDVSAHDWADTEEEAVEAARAVVEGFAADRPAIAIQMHGHASHILKGVNAAKRAQRPAKGDGDAVQREFLYGVYGGGEETDPCVVPYQITKRTPKRVYYVRSDWGDGDVKIGFVNRQELEEKGEVYNGGVHWSSPDWHLYVVPPELGQRRPEPPDLGELKAAMAAAHPDRGGTDAEFIAARDRYVKARRRP